MYRTHLMSAIDSMRTTGLLEAPLGLEALGLSLLNLEVNPALEVRNALQQDRQVQAPRRGIHK